MLDQQIHGRRQRARAAAPVVTGAGGWGTVLEHHTDRVTVDLDDDAPRPWGPVPFLIASGTGPPAIDDRVFLHLDSNGQPAYAVIWR